MWLFLGCNQYWAGWVYVQEHTEAISAVVLALKHGSFVVDSLFIVASIIREEGCLWSLYCCSTLYPFLLCDHFATMDWYTWLWYLQVILTSILG